MSFRNPALTRAKASHTVAKYMQFGGRQGKDSQKSLKAEHGFTEGPGEGKEKPGRRCPVQASEELGSSPTPPHPTPGHWTPDTEPSVLRSPLAPEEPHFLPPTHSGPLGLWEIPGYLLCSKWVLTSQLFQES